MRNGLQFPEDCMWNAILKYQEHGWHFVFQSSFLFWYYRGATHNCYSDSSQWHFTCVSATLILNRSGNVRSQQLDNLQWITYNFFTSWLLMRQGCSLANIYFRENALLNPFVVVEIVKETENLSELKHPKNLIHRSSLRGPQAIWKPNYANITLQKEVTNSDKDTLLVTSEISSETLLTFTWYCTFKTILLNDLSFSELLVFLTWF